MPYNEEFYKKYRAYLLEPAVRRAHNLMFETFHKFIGQRYARVIDLGCGTCELKAYDVPYAKYAGIDLYPTNDEVIVADFLRTPPEGLVKLCGFNPDVFTSLFASEPLLEDRKRYEFYERLFREIPSLHFGMVSGFIYRQRSWHYSVKEGDILSYQTIERQFDFVNPLFSEFRCYIEAPSEMFGKDVVEVWKFFRRTSDAVSVTVRRDGNASSHHGVPDRSQDNRSDSPAAVRSSDPAPVPGPVDDRSPVLPQPTPTGLMETFLGIGALLLGLACTVAGAAYGDLLGMTIGGTVGVGLVWLLMNGWSSLGPVAVRCRKIILGKSDPDYVVPTEPVPPGRVVKFLGSCRALVHKAIVKAECYFNHHTPTQVMENGHLFQRCEHCNQFLHAVIWNVRNQDGSRVQEERGELRESVSRRFRPGPNPDARETERSQNLQGEPPTGRSTESSLQASQQIPRPALGKGPY